MKQSDRTLSRAVVYWVGVLFLVLGLSHCGTPSQPKTENPQKEPHGKQHFFEAIHENPQKEKSNHPEFSRNELQSEQPQRESLKEPSQSPSESQAEPNTEPIVHTEQDGGSTEQLPEKPPKKSPNTLSPLGINLSGLAYWMTGWPFVNIMQHASAAGCNLVWLPYSPRGKWTTADKQHPEECQDLQARMDPNGWPRSLPSAQNKKIKYRAVRTLMKTVSEAWPSGKYIVLYDGKGTLSFSLGAKKLSETPGRIILDVKKKGGGIYLAITATDPNKNGNYIRNIRVIMPGFEKNYIQQVFHPLFLQRLNKFKVLRFMDWQQTNDSKQKLWSDRPQPNHASQAIKGVSVEQMVMLANRLQADPWFCMPHMATDDYIRRFAQYVQKHLHPSRKAYIEYSNETWNGIFEQAKYVQDQGMRLKLDTQRFTAGNKYTAQRSLEIFAIWNRVFGTSSKQRLIRVMASQASNVWVSQVRLTWKDAYKHTDALAIAPYFGGYLGSPKEQNRVQNMKLTELFQELKKKALPIAQTWINKQASETTLRKVRLIAYEGGQHLVGYNGVENNAKITNLFMQANQDPRMKEVYIKYLEMWKQEKGQMFVHYSNVSKGSKWGSWGALTQQDEPTSQAPKYDALLYFIQKYPKWW